jgi:hypothetical protein
MQLLLVQPLYIPVTCATMASCEALVCIIMHAKCFSQDQNTCNMDLPGY